MKKLLLTGYPGFLASAIKEWFEKNDWQVSISLAIKNKKFAIFIYLFICFFVVHTAYGFGYWNGIIKILLKQSFNVKCNH